MVLLHSIVCYKLNISSKNPNWREADQLAINKAPPKTNPSSGREEDLNPGPPDYKSSALPLALINVFFHNESRRIN